jgi:hypothetical protein
MKHSHSHSHHAPMNIPRRAILSGMSSTGTITVCINAGASMKRNETILGGQFWQQEGRSMTAVNGTIDGMPNTRESAILPAAVEAVEWRHPIEPMSDDGKRKTSRVVIYPEEMPQLEEAMIEFSQNPSEQEDGSHIAYSKILEKCAEYESSPRFFREDSSEILNDPELAAAVPRWMNTAAQVSVGSRDLVLENGPDTMNSSDEDSPTGEHGDKLPGVYVGDPKAPVRLSLSPSNLEGAGRPSPDWRLLNLRYLIVDRSYNPVTAGGQNHQSPFAFSTNSSSPFRE